jgi:HNH endonuclease
MSRYIAENLRQLVALRANFCCEYCQISEEASFFSFQIDHIISLKHGGKTTSINLAYSCFPCNNAKGSDVGTVLLASRDFIRLFNPRIDIWQEHFLKENSVFYAKSQIGEATIKVLKLNDIDRIVERSFEN